MLCWMFVGVSVVLDDCECEVVSVIVVLYGCGCKCCVGW